MEIGIKLPIPVAESSEVFFGKGKNQVIKEVQS